MTGSNRVLRIGKVLAAGALIGLAGCQQVPSRPTAPSPLGWGSEPKGGGTTITPAQEADVQISMGRAAEQQGDLDQAMAAYRAALGRDHRRADAYARLAILNDKQGKFRESAELYRKALAVQPGDPEIFCDMGYSLYLQRRWAEAEMNLRQAVAVNRDHQRAHNNLALLLVRDNRLDDALAEFHKGGSEPVQAHMNLAFALTIDQRWESARTEYERALAIDPSCQLAKARLEQLNTLVSKRDSPNGAGPDRPSVSTATAASPARRGLHGPTATPEQYAPTSARRDPALLTTAAVSPARSRRFGPDARAIAPAAAPKRRDSQPQTDTALPDDTSSSPLLSSDSVRPVQSGTRSSDRHFVRPPRSYNLPRTARLDAESPADSTSTATPRPTQTPRTATPGASPTSSPGPVAMDPTRKSAINP